MNNQNIFGTYKLIEFKITDLRGNQRSWGKNAKGMLIYTPEGTMSVSIQAEKSYNDQPFTEIALFYSGYYEIKSDNEIVHHVLYAINPDRVGKELIRNYNFEERNFVLTNKADYGESKLVWKKKLI